ncbi:MAG: hypothetical protein K6A41_04310 [Bacteroidales bacterium]|nr:hypothetical protein [Bacteroidales bacterium]
MAKIISFIVSKAKYILGGLAAIIIVALSGVTAHQKNAVRDARTQIETLEASIAEKNELITRLAAMEAVHCEVGITVKNTAVLGSNTSGNIAQEAEQISSYLRGEILDKIMQSENNQ